jgi:hypothetical protein
MAKVLGASTAAQTLHTHIKARRPLDRLLMGWILFF